MIKIFGATYESDEPQNFVKDFRARESMPQKALLELFLRASDGQVKLTQSQLSDIENGRKPLSVEKAQVMCKVFNCRVEDIINMKFLDRNDGTDNVINLNLFSTEQLKTMRDALITEINKRESL